MSAAGIEIVIGVGCTIGLLGAAIGSWASIHNTKGPRERAFVIRAVIYAWLLMIVIMLPFLYIGSAYFAFAWIPYTILMSVGISRWNKKQAQIRMEESQIINGGK
ncbi:MAG TPA: hypothetical protein P5244_02530 [Syntrophales bacterium]|nr:hypothetical protein [Syntrophales bacterium]